MERNTRLLKMPSMTPDPEDEPTLVHDHRDKHFTETNVRHIPSRCTSSGNVDLYRPDHATSFRLGDTLTIVSMQLPKRRSDDAYFLLLGMDGKREFWWRVDR